MVDPQNWDTEGGQEPEGGVEVIVWVDASAGHGRNKTSLKVLVLCNNSVLLYLLLDATGCMLLTLIL